MGRLIAITFTTFLFYSFLGCNKSPKCWGKKESSDGIIAADFNPCLNCNILTNQDHFYVINSNTEYQTLSLLAHSNQTVCQFENINFNFCFFFESNTINQI